MSPRSALVLAGVVLLMPAVGHAKGVELDSREYKLMLQPGKLGGRADEKVAELATELGALIKGAVGRKAAEDFAEKGLEPKKERVVRFWDTDGCTLGRRGFALRERTNAAGSADPEITLKFRSTDLFLAAGTPLPGGPGSESKLEEDVGPLAARQGEAATAVVAEPHSARSQYARSTKQPVRTDALPQTLRDVAEIYPTFEESLGARGGKLDMSAALRPSPTYRERVFESGKMKLAGDTKAELSVTFWYAESGVTEAPTLAEVSFKYDVPKEGLPRAAAQQALDLFLAMQKDLDWADPGAPTKTALVSPSACAGV